MAAYFRRLAQRSGLPGKALAAGAASGVTSTLPVSRAPRAAAEADAPVPVQPMDLAVSAMVEADPPHAAPLPRSSPAALGLTGLDPEPATFEATPVIPPVAEPRQSPTPPDAPVHTPAVHPLESSAAVFDPPPAGPSRSASDAPPLPMIRYLPVTQPPALEPHLPAVDPFEEPSSFLAGRRPDQANPPLEVDLEMPTAGAATVTLHSPPRGPLNTADAPIPFPRNRDRYEEAPSFLDAARPREASFAPAPRPVHVHIGTVSMEIRQPAPPPRPQALQAQPAPTRPRPTTPSPSTPSAGGFRPSRHYLRG